MLNKTKLFKKIITTILFIFIGSAQLFAQIKWDEKRPLTWKDFKAPVDNSSLHFANTKTSTNYQYHLHYHNSTYTLTFEVECVFLPNGSWYKPYKQIDALLHHEQLHFDLEEIFARKLMAAFKAKMFTANYAAEVKAIYDGIAQQATGVQKKYDAETNFGELKQEQLKWEKVVQEQLQQTTTLLRQ